MIKKSKIIVFFGTEDFSLASLQALIDSGYNIGAVVTKPDSKRGRGHILSMPSIKRLAISYNIPVWQPLKIAEINDNIKKIGNNVVGVLASFGKIIPESTINLFTPGIINIHPSLLPKYRGPSPIETTIINGDDQTGVSIMRLSAGMDSGPIYGQIIYKLSGHETRPELYNILAEIGSKELINLLPNILNDSLQPIPQDDTKATYCKLLDKKDNQLRPNLTEAKAAERIIRAHLGFPKTKYNILGYPIIIIKSHVSEEQKTPLDILCQDNKYLSIDELVAPSGHTMSAKDFLNGYNN
jgi:methionyl-tRNA formyltransferase